MSSENNKSSLNIQEIIMLHQRAMDLIDLEPNEAAKITRKILSYGPNFYIAYPASGLLIDIGNILCNEVMVQEGITLIENNLDGICSKATLAPTTYYNLANGYFCLFNLKRMKDPNYGFFIETEMELARKFFRKALDQEIEDHQLLSQIYVNLGNCYDQVGRAVEAQDCYALALKYNPNHGMALGNKGQGLYFYAALSDEHQGTILKEAYTLLVNAVEKGVTKEAAATFLSYIHLIETRVKDKRFFIDDFDSFPGCRIEAENNFDEYLTKFCLDNKLFLNVCNFCQRCDAAIGDTAIITKMIAEPNDFSFLLLSSYLNHIKQEYAAARFLLVLSQYKGMNLDFVDRNVKLINSHDNTRQNIYIQLLKEAFQSFYNLLDKIACFINDYLRLGIPSTSVDFRKIWYLDAGKKIVREPIKTTRNPALNALFNLHLDLERGEYITLRYSRNALTHRFLNVKAELEKEDAENMLEGTLIKRAIQLATIVRSAIIYVLFLIYTTENVREANLKGNMLPLKVDELPKALRKRLQ
jgi:tetratricopeptide (TPR) repeat protein